MGTVTTVPDVQLLTDPIATTGPCAAAGRTDTKPAKNKIVKNLITELIDLRRKNKKVDVEQRVFIGIQFGIIRLLEM